MPITVEVPELGRSVEFPDDMSHEDIASAITQHLGSIAEAGFEKAVGVSQKAASMFGVGRSAQESMLRAEEQAKEQARQDEAFLPLPLRSPRVPGPSTTTGGPRVPLASYAETIAEPAEELTRPRIQAPEATITEADNPVSVVGKEAWNIAKGVPEFLTSTAGLMSIVSAKGAPTATTALFSGQMFNDLGQQILSAHKNWGSMSRNQQIKAVVDMVGTGALGGLLAKHTTTGVLDATVPARALAKEIRTSPMGLPAVEPEAAKGPVAAQIQEAMRPVPPAGMVTLQSLRPAVNLVPEAPGEVAKVAVGEQGDRHNDINKRHDITTEEMDKKTMVVSPTGEAPPPGMTTADKVIDVGRQAPAAAGIGGKVEPATKTAAAATHASELAKAQAKSSAAQADYDKFIQSGFDKETSLEAARVLDPQFTPSPEPAVAPTPEPPTPAPVKAEPSAPPPPAQPKGETGGGELKALVKANVKADPRLEEPGISKKSKPNSLIIQIRDLESNPIKEIVLPSSGDPLTDAKTAERVIKEHTDSKNTSLRESMAVSTGPNGRAVNHFGMSPNGMVWSKASDLIKARKQAQKPKPIEYPTAPRTPLDYGYAMGEVAIGDLDKMSPKHLRELEQTLGAYVGTRWEYPPNPKSDTTANRMGTKALYEKIRQHNAKTVDISAEVTPEQKQLPPPTPPPVEQKGVEPEKGPGIGQGPGAKTYAPSAKPEPPETREGTGLKNAVAELEAAGIGHDLPETELRAMVPRWEQAGDVLRADPNAGRRLADDLISNPERGMTDEDSALLLRHKVELINAVNDAASRTHIGDAESRAIADREYMAKSDELKALLDAVKKRGSQWGREGRWRQAMAYEDYTFATQEGLLRSSKGGLPLTEEERSRLMADVEAHRKNAAEQEAHRIKAEQQTRELSAKLELERIEKENLKKQIPKFDKRILAAAEKIVQNIKTSADAARARIAARRAQPGAQAGPIDPADIDDYAIIASSHIAEFGLDAAKVIDRLAIEFGENIRSAADQIISKANELLDNIKAPDPVKRVIKKKATTAEEQTELTNKIREKLQGKRLDQITPLVQKLARTFSDMGVRGWRPLGDAVHGVLKEMIPNLDYRETLDAISGHGKFRIPNQEEGARALRDAKAQMNEIRKIQEVIAREPVKPTGLRRDLPSDVKRRLTQIYENVKRKFGVVSDDPATQLRSALQARKTYYEHRISDLQDEISARKRTVKTKAPPPTDPELERLITEYKAVKAAHDEVFGKRELTDEQRAELESKSLDRQIAEVERQLKEGDIFPVVKKEAFRATANEAKRANLEALKAERENLRESIQPTQRLTPEEKRLNAIKAGMSRRQADLLDRMARGDFAPKKKAPPVPLDPEGARLMAQGREIELRFDKARRQAELAQRSPAKKFVDRFVVGTYNLGRAVAVMWHGTVGMFTHAGGLFWRATTAAIWWRNFIRQFPMWLKPAYHEQLIHRLKTDPDFHTWLKAGAKIDPDRIYTDYELYGKWMGAAGGARGFDALKLTRMELNKMEWEKVSDEIKADPEKADAARKAIAEINNRATGTESLYGKVGPVDLSGVAHAIMFAPKLYASRWSRVVLDPIKTVETFANWEKATPAERLAAKMKLKHAAEFIGIYLGALAVNQGLLLATGSKQKVNFKDPDKSDWLKFKGFGKNVVADGGLLDPVRLLGQVVWGDLVKPRTKQERFLKGTRFEAAGKHLVNYVRSKFNPSLGLVVDSATQQDYAGRALPFSSEPSKYKSQKPYKWGEWLLSHGPIPISMGTRVAFDELQKRGLSKVDAAALLEGAAAAAVGMTGVHETEDYSLKK